MIPRGSPAAASGGGSLGSGAGPAEGSAKARKAKRIKSLRQHSHPVRKSLGATPPLVSDVTLAGGSKGVT